MAANANDVFMEVGSPGTATTLSSPGYTSGVSTSITVGSTSNWPTNTGIIFAIDEATVVDGVEVRVDGTYNEFEGVVASATSITSVDYIGGDAERSYSAGALTRVYIPVSAERENRLAQGMRLEHSQLDGTHTNITQSDSNYIKDSNGNELLKWSATTSAVNEITVKNAATANAPRLAPSGGDTNIDLNLRGKGTGAVKHGAGNLSPFAFDYVASGCVWTGDSLGATRAASMTSGVVVINGNPLTVATVTARTFTASKDTYIDASDNGDGTALLTYTEATINAASPALAANSVRIGIIVTAAGSIAAAGSINQGEETKVLPIASSIPYAVTDSLGNLICPRDPNRKILGNRQIIAGQSGISAEADITGLSVPVIVPTGRKIKITVSVSSDSSDTTSPPFLSLKEGATFLNGRGTISATGNSGYKNLIVEHLTTPTAGSHTYKATLQRFAGAGTVTVEANAAAALTPGPAWIRVELS